MLTRLRYAILSRSSWSRVARAGLFVVIALMLVDGTTPKVLSHDHDTARAHSHLQDHVHRHGLADDLLQSHDDGGALDFDESPPRDDLEASTCHVHVGTALAATAVNAPEWPAPLSPSGSHAGFQQLSAGRHAVGIIDTPLRPPRTPIA